MNDLELQLTTVLTDGEVTVRVTPIGVVYGTKPLAAAGEKLGAARGRAEHQ